MSTGKAFHMPFMNSVFLRDSVVRIPALAACNCADIGLKIGFI